MDEIRQSILREQEARKARLSTMLNTSFEENEKKNDVEEDEIEKEVKKSKSDEFNKAYSELFDEDLFEKAKHQIGDSHPKWPQLKWTDLGGGKFGWRTGTGRGKRASTGGTTSQTSYAKETDTKTLENVANSDKAPKELKDAAKKELQNRGEKTGTTKKKNKQTNKADIENFIYLNYATGGKLTFRTNESSGKIIVDCSDSIRTNVDSTKLTDGTFEWGKIDGDFDCRRCDKLESLEGAPKEVNGDFNCSNCDKLESLEGAPEVVGDEFYCRNCSNLKSLKGAPKKVDANFDCSDCENLESLEGAPKEVRWGFYCNGCKNLTSLKGAPKKVRYFDCKRCDKLESLEGAPEDAKIKCDDRLKS